MFEQPNPATARRQRTLLAASVGVHAVILAWLLHAPEPRLLTPVSVALGQNGTSVTRLFWSSKNPDDSSHSSSDLATERYKHQRLGQKLSWKAPAQLSKLTAPQAPVARAEQQDKSRNPDALRSRPRRAGGPSLRNAHSRPTLRRRDPSRAPRRDLRSGRLPVATSHRPRQRSHRNHHRRARRDRQQNRAPEPRSRDRLEVPRSARELALPSRDAEWLSHFLETRRYLSLPRPRLVLSLPAHPL